MGKYWSDCAKVDDTAILSSAFNEIYYRILIIYIIFFMCSYRISMTCEVNQVL